MKTASTEPGHREKWYLDHLDALRGIAVLAVVMVHSAYIDPAVVPLRPRLLNVALSGQRGVSLFFIVSAFTLFLSHDKRKREKRPLRNFFLRRFFRLAPMFYLATAITVVALAEFRGPPVDIVLSMFFLNGFSPRAIFHGAAGSWSVADEAMFYACLPLLYSSIKNLRSAMIWLACSAAFCSWATRFAAARYPMYSEFFTFMGFLPQFPIFVMGITGYFVWKEFIVGFDLTLDQKKQSSLLILATALMLYCALLPFTNATLLQSSAAGLLLLVALSLYPWYAFVNPITRFLGKISYSIYLLHFAINIPLKRYIFTHGEALNLARHPVAEFMSILLGTLAPTIPLAYVTWRWIEEPGIALGKRVIARLESKEIT